jgi:agmatine deiminase
MVIESSQSLNQEPGNQEPGNAIQLDHPIQPDPRGAFFDARVPAEWEPLACVWLAWPHNPKTWPGTSDGVPRLAKIPQVYQALVGLIAQSAPVQVIASDGPLDQADQMVGGIGGVTVVDIATDDAWIRDYGPTFVQSRQTGETHAVDWQYNAWGGKYPPWDQDAAAAKAICETLSMRRVRSELCVEGGAMEFDGDRRMITTTMCMMDENRNPIWDAPRISQELYRQTGVMEIAWIDGGGLQGDDTDGHIDQLARFIDRENVVVAVAAPSDPNHDGLRRNFQQLQAWGASTDPGVTVHPLMIPPPRYVDDSRVPESYCNFLRLGPDRLLMPSFDPETDRQAAEQVSGLTNATIDFLDCRELVWGLGALHCCSRDQPANVA